MLSLQAPRDSWPLILIFVLSLPALSRADEDLLCLPVEPQGWRIIESDLQRQAMEALDRRAERYEQLKTPEQIRDYQKTLREFFLQQLGGLPERTPLNPQTVGTLEGDGYRIEKVIFESQPQHHVTALLYLPTTEPPYPGVLISSGHSRNAKAADYNQRLGIALARNGIAALAYDPIGQGERSQILKADGQPQFESTTDEHFLIGVGCILLGTNTARYRVWDGMRAIDYLCSRAEIDPERIGFTGCSGGGTLTSYVMALDDRVRCAAPACYLTTFRRLIETIGPQDAEQNIFGQLAFGMDQPDYVLMRAPRPTLISATTGDFFDIQGTWDNFRQAKRLYTRFNHPECVDLVEAEGGHGVQPENLVAITRWMRRWLLEKDDAVTLSEIVVHPDAELLCTDEGQVLALPGERSVFDLNLEYERQLADERRRFWSEASPAEALARVRQIAGVRPLADIEPLDVQHVGRVEREGYHVDKLVLRTASGIPLPALTYHPPEPQEDAYLYVHEQGKTADGEPGGRIEQLVREGYVVVSVDLRGFGETARPSQHPKLGDWQTFYLAYLLGQSLVGLRTEELLACAQFVANYETETPRQVHLVGVGAAAVPALHAAALEPQLLASLALHDAPESWASLIGQSVPEQAMTNAVHGALRVYDFEDLRRAWQQNGEGK